MIFCMFMQLSFYKLWFPPHFEHHTVGNILPHIFPFSNLFENNEVMSWGISLKHHLVINDHFYKIILLIREMVVWLIHVVWIVWSWLWCQYGVFWCVCLLSKNMKKGKETKSKHRPIKSCCKCNTNFSKWEINIFFQNKIQWGDLKNHSHLLLYLFPLSKIFLKILK